MKIKYFLLFVLIYFTPVLGSSDQNFFDKAKNLFEKKEYNKSKFLFQRNIVHNPKNAQSYLYLAKIFQIEDNKKELIKNLDTTLLLEPNNEEAMYILINVELEKSNFSKVKKLNEKFKLICSSLCPKISLINERLKDFQEKEDS